MRKFLQSIYRKPKAVRDNYALAVAGLFTALVCVFWVTARLQSPIEGGAIASDRTSPFETLIKKSKEQLASVKAAVAEVPFEIEDSPAPTATTSVMNLVLSEEDRAAAAARASSTATSTIEIQYKEVLIGTTSASTTVQ